jgi:hypothetical protein
MKMGSMCSPNDASWHLVGGEIFGARPDDTGPLGGGAGYAKIVTTGDHLVADVRGLIRALAVASVGQVVFVESGADIDLTDRVITDGVALRIPAGVTLAGNRGHAGSCGGLIFSDAFGTLPLIETAGPGVRVTGLRLRGPDPKRRLEFHYRVFHEGCDGDNAHDLYYRFPNSRGICTSHDRLEIDNCEISAWSHAGVYLENGKGHRVHHNFIHHCQRMGLGYGITHNQASESLIEFNLFQDNKHHIAGTGSPGQAYEARHNVVLAPTESYLHPITGGEYGQDHLFDMHGGRDRGDGTEIAGDRLSIHHNTFVPPYLGISICGNCEHGAEIHHNWFQARGVADESIVGEGRIEVGPNLHGVPPWLGSLRGEVHVLAPPGTRHTAPGRLRARLKNIGPAPVAATLRLKTFPEGMLAGGDESTLSVELAAGAEQYVILPLVPTPAGRARGAFAVQLVAAAGGVTDASGLRVPGTNVRVVGHQPAVRAADPRKPG